MSRRFQLSASDVWPGCRQIEVEGELDLAVSAELVAMLAQARDQRRHVLLDLEGCEFVDASGLAALVAANASFEQRGMRLLLLGVHGQVERLLVITGFAEELRIGPEPDGTRWRPPAAPAPIPELVA